MLKENKLDDTISSMMSYMGETPLVQSLLRSQGDRLDLLKETSKEIYSSGRETLGDICHTGRETLGKLYGAFKKICPPDIRAPWVL